MKKISFGLILFLLWIMACRLTSVKDSSRAQRSIINYLTQKLGKDAQYEPLTFGKLDTVYVKDTLKTYLSILLEEQKHNSILYTQIQKSRNKYELNPYHRKLFLTCSDVLDYLSVKTKLLQNELDSLNSLLPKVPKNSIAYYQLSHQYKYASPIKKIKVLFYLDFNLEIMESRIMEDIWGNDGWVTIYQANFYNDERKRTCDGRVLSKLRLDGVLLPLKKKVKIKVKPGRHWFSWQLPQNSFAKKVEFLPRKQSIQIKPGKHYTFLGTDEKVYLMN